MQFLWFFLSFKFLISLCLFSIYTYYYPNRLEADIFKFFDDSHVVYNSLYNSPTDFKNLIFETNLDDPYYVNGYLQKMNNWDRIYETGVYNDSRTIIKLNAIFRFISFGEFHVHSLFFCFLSLTGLVAFFRVAKKIFNNSQSILVIMLFFLPSLMFWTSGILKESVHLFALGLLLFSLDKVLRFKKISLSIVGLFVSLLLLVYIKIYVLLALIPSFTCYIISRFSKLKKWKIYVPVLLLFSVVVLFSKQFSPNLNFVEIIETKQENFIRFAEHQDAGSRFPLTNMDQSIGGLLKVVPEGVVNCFIRPLPWESKNIIELPAILENILVFIGLLLLLKLVIEMKVVIVEEHKNFIWFSIVSVFILYAMIGVVTPVSGSLIRYKVTALPFLVIIFIYFFQNLKLFLNLDAKLSPYVLSKDRLLHS